MSNPPHVRSIKELGLADSDELKLHIELIRIIEKEIDEIKASDARDGWTTWAIVGGIAGSLLLFFGESRKIASFPTEHTS